MSGTSFDAVDAAAADLEIRDGTVHLRPLGLVSAPYPAEVVDTLRSALPPAATTMATVCRLDTAVGQAFADLAARADAELCDGRAELVVSHGQTVFHWAEDGRVRGTLQLGQPAWVAERTGLPVVSDLRSRDVAAGGQGAPLVSALDVLWLRSRERASVALNLGGIANVTVVAPGAEPVAFDTGPASALLDAVVQRATGGAEAYDLDGARAAAGHVDADLLAALLAEPYYARPAPKSTGKELFSPDYLDPFLAGRPALALPDLLATLTALTAETAAAAVRAAGAVEVVAAGGGTRNPTLLAALRDRLDGVPLLLSDELGLPAGAKEAYAFALLGYFTLAGLPASVPSCTGARHASVLGSLTPGRDGWPRWERPPARPTQLVVDQDRSSR
ncbi:anhydro-N-acetylmuramic acid kinase [Microlunatus capsulatus]|uniref:Anhydro-N-acetylmuramic acid kinase n=2 Tax=Microlunatus capsulatus TaxID=99117 RepID=A0ABS4ZA24_9ACTN|nr:anhydro-N-acetylmuramic acid kinase [Microlunatus capsulatus]